MTTTGATGVDVKRARRWFWILTAVATLAMGGLYKALQSASGPGTGLLLLLSAVVLAASSVQAARILAALSGPRRPVRQLWAQRAVRSDTAAHARGGVPGRGPR